MKWIKEKDLEIWNLSYENMKLIDLISKINFDTIFLHVSIINTGFYVENIMTEELYLLNFNGRIYKCPDLDEAKRIGMKLAHEHFRHVVAEMEEVVDYLRNLYRE